MKWKAILLGGVAQSTVFAVLFVWVQPPTAAYVPTWVVGGAVGGWTSDRFQNEFIDGGSAAVLGVVLSVLVVAGMTLAAPIPLGLRVEFTFITLVFGTMLTVLFGMAAGVVGAVVGQFAGSLDRR